MVAKERAGVRAWFVEGTGFPFWPGGHIILEVKVPNSYLVVLLNRWLVSAASFILVAEPSSRYSQHSRRNELILTMAFDPLLPSRGDRDQRVHQTIKIPSKYLAERASTPFSTEGMHEV